MFGSVTAAAINGKLHRHIADIDLLVDEKKHHILQEELLQASFTPTGGFMGLSEGFLNLKSFVHSSLLSTGYFYGTWSHQGFTMKNKLLQISIDQKAIIPTTYSLNSTSFIGLPKAAIATGIMSSKDNPKREQEVKMLERKGIKPMKNDYIHIKTLGISTDWLFPAIRKTLHFIGAIRVKRGLTYDPWRTHVHK